MFVREGPWPAALPLRKSGVETVAPAEAADFLAVMAEGTFAPAPAPGLAVADDASAPDFEGEGGRAIDTAAPADAAPPRVELQFWLVAEQSTRAEIAATTGDGPPPGPFGATGRPAMMDVAGLLPQARTLPKVDPSPPARTTEPRGANLPPPARPAEAPASVSQPVFPVNPSQDGIPPASAALPMRAAGAAQTPSDDRRTEAASAFGPMVVDPAGDGTIPRLPAGAVSGQRSVAEPDAAEGARAVRDKFGPPGGDAARLEVRATEGPGNGGTGAALGPAASQTPATGTIAAPDPAGAPRVWPRGSKPQEAVPDLQGSSRRSQPTEPGDATPPPRDAGQAESRESRPGPAFRPVAAAWPARSDGGTAAASPADGKPPQDAVRIGLPRQIGSPPLQGGGAGQPPAPQADRQTWAAPGSDTLPLSLIPPEETVASLTPEAVSARKPAELPLAGSAPPPPEVARGVAAQLAAAVTATSEGSFEIKLSPEELGRVTLTPQVTDDSVVLAVQAER